MGLPTGNAAAWNNSNSNWEQPAYTNLITTVDSMGHSSWPEGDMQWNTQNSGANTQPYAAQSIGSFQLMGTPTPIYRSQPFNAH